MYLSSLIFNQKTSESFFNNQLFLNETDILHIHKLMISNDTILGCCIVQTCNRFEIYFSSKKQHESMNEIYRILSTVTNIMKEEIESKFLLLDCYETIHHLFSVTSGIDSLLIGEDQILGQIRNSYLLSKKNKTMNKVLHSLFQKSLHVGKRVRSESMINKNALSYSGLTKDILKDNFNHEEKVNIMLIGAGEIGTTIAKNLIKNSNYSLSIPFRSTKKREIIHSIHSSIKQFPFDEYKKKLDLFDVIICCTKSTEFLLQKKDFIDINRKTKLIIDLSVPGVVSPMLKNNTSLNIVDMNDLKLIVQQNKEKRVNEIKKAKSIISEEEILFKKWIQAIHTDPIIEKLKEQVECIKEEELFNLNRKLDNNPSCTKDNIEEFAHKLVYRILHYPIKELKNTFDKKTQYDLLSSTITLFHLDNDASGTLKSEIINSIIGDDDEND